MVAYNVLVFECPSIFSISPFVYQRFILYPATQ